MVDYTAVRRRVPAQSALSRSAAGLPLRGEILSASVAFSRYGEDLARLQSLCRDDVRYGSTAVWQALWPSNWKPHVLLLRENDHLQAAFFYRKRSVLGVDTGLCRAGDALGEPLLFCAAGKEDRWLTEAAVEILRRRRNFLLVMHCAGEADSCAGQLTDGPELRIHRATLPVRFRHTLQPTFDDSIRSLGHRTRRNLRHALRHVQAAGWQFRQELTRSEALDAMKSLASRATHPVPKGALQQQLDLDSHLPHMFFMGLCDREGVWLSILSGYRTPDGTTDIFWQCNARVPNESMSLTLRALLIQEEARRGTKQIRYLNGANRLVEHCCQEESSTQISVERMGLRLRLARWLMGKRFPAPSPLPAASA